MHGRSGHRENRGNPRTAVALTALSAQSLGIKPSHYSINRAFTVLFIEAGEIEAGASTMTSSSHDDVLATPEWVGGKIAH